VVLSATYPDWGISALTEQKLAPDLTKEGDWIIIAKNRGELSTKLKVQGQTGKVPPLTANFIDDTTQGNLT